MPGDLERLAELIRVRNDTDQAIARLIGRPAGPGNIGEFVAAQVFAIRLMGSGSHPGYDGVFQEGPFAGKTVNIKTYSRHESVLDISPHPCDCYLVLTGPPGQARFLPWVIESVFLLEREHLLATLRARGVKIGIATSVRKADWEAARIFPPHQSSPLQLSPSPARRARVLLIATRELSIPATDGKLALRNENARSADMDGDLGCRHGRSASPEPGRMQGRLAPVCTARAADVFPAGWRWRPRRRGCGEIPRVHRNTGPFLR
ncbi:MAG TPA: hypothetical protein VF070_03405 [Streptosporangiaceae bacterium]